MPCRISFGLPCHSRFKLALFLGCYTICVFSLFAARCRHLGMAIAMKGMVHRQMLMPQSLENESSMLQGLEFGTILLSLRMHRVRKTLSVTIVVVNITTTLSNEVLQIWIIILICVHKYPEHKILKIDWLQQLMMKLVRLRLTWFLGNLIKKHLGKL